MRECDASFWTGARVTDLSDEGLAELGDHAAAILATAPAWSLWLGELTEREQARRRAEDPDGIEPATPRVRADFAPSGLRLVLTGIGSLGEFEGRDAGARRFLACAVRVAAAGLIERAALAVERAFHRGPPPPAACEAAAAKTD